MARTGFAGNARRVLTAAILLYALGCGKDADTSTRSSAGGSADEGTEDSDDDDDEPSRDAGARRDGSTRDAAKPADNGATKPPDTSRPEPKELVNLDDCGDSNPAGLDAATVERLKAGGSAEGMAILYPYDQTVFPRGLTAPLWMWQGGGGGAVYVRIRSKYFEYDGCLPPTGSGQLQLPQNVWETAGEQTMGAATPFTVELTTLDGQAARGPITEEIVIAQATLKGSIYYNSYNSRLGGFGGLGGGRGGGLPAGLPAGNNGSVLRIKPGQPAEFFARQGACTGCHAVSANGERLITVEWGVPAFDGSDGQVYNLAPDTAANATPARTAFASAFVGLSPDGSVYLATATDLVVGPNVTGPAVPTLTNATLYETDTGTVINGSGIPATAAMPTFSADGRMIAFTDLASGGTTLALMDYDPDARKASNLRNVYTSTDGYAGWPFLLPDNGAVVCTVGDANNYTGLGAYIGGLLRTGPRSDLMIVDAQTGKATILAQAMGFRTPEDAAQGKSYLPFGAEELHQHYYPTVSPVAAGGYFWVFFDSIRHYGNLGIHRNLWGAAIRIQRSQGGEFGAGDGLYELDPSAPAFYLPGQELDGANHRAFTALDPCRADGESCETGIDCCSGFCTDGVCGPPRECAETNEACRSDEDCCNPQDACIGGFCGQIVLL